MEHLRQRIHNLTELFDRLSSDSRTVMQTDNPELPAYMTTHFDKDYACVQIASQVEGTTGPTHVHEAKEWFFVLKGAIIVETDKKTIVGAGHMFEVPEGAQHKITAYEDAIFVVITMPSVLKEIADNQKKI